VRIVTGAAARAAATIASSLAFTHAVNRSNTALLFSPSE
jgi:hypothetical protein